MCGIFGLIIQNKYEYPRNSVKHITDALFRLTNARGKEASGVAISINDTTRIYKLPIQGTQLIKTSKYRKLQNCIVSADEHQYPVIILGHSRIATNSPLTDNCNNQPVIGHSTIVIHNGVVVNDMALWKKYPRLKRKLLVDTEIISALYEEYRRNHASPKQAMQNVYKEIVGETNIAILEVGAPYLVLATNTGSLFYSRQDGFFVFASERYILTKLIQSEASLPNSLIPQISQVLANNMVVINLNNVSLEQSKLITNTKLSIHQFSHTNKKPENSFVRPIRDESPAKSISTSSDIYRNSINKLEKHIPDYKAVSQIKRCSMCIMPSTMPLIAFDKYGICNFCRTYIKQEPLGINALESIIAPYRSQTGRADCIVAFSGGRDSSYGLHYAKKVLHLNPIAYTYDWGMVTDIARRNQSRMCAALGIEHVWVSADIAQKRKNIQKNIYAWLANPDLGMVTLLMAGDKQAEYYAEDLKRKTGMQLTIYSRGNQIEDERFKFGYYGIFNGTPRGVIHNLSWTGKIKMLCYYGNQFISNTKYLNESLIDTAWAYASAFLMPHNFIYLWHYIPWNEEKIISTLVNLYSWERPKDTSATWRIDDGTPPFYNYIYYQIQGFTENDGLRSNQVREGILTRKKALELANLENRPRYESLAWYFDLLHLDGDKILSTIDNIPRLY